MIAAGAFLGWIGYYYVETNTSNQRKIKELTKENLTLTSTNATLTRDFSNAKLGVVRAKANEVKSDMLRKEAADAFIRALPKGWTVVGREELPNKEFVHRRYKLSYRSVNIKMWPEINSFFQQIQKTPGLAVDMFDIQTMGDNRNRNFIRIIIGISIYVNNEK